MHKLETNGFKVTFENGRAIIQKGKDVVAIANKNETNMYALNFTTMPCSVLLTGSLEIWHQRLGHLNYTDLKVLPNYVEGMNIEDLKTPPSCTICTEGKQTRLPHNQKRTRAKRPLEVNS